MNDHAGRESTCGREMGNNEFSWSGLTKNNLLTTILKITIPVVYTKHSVMISSICSSVRQEILIEKKVDKLVKFVSL